MYNFGDELTPEHIAENYVAGYRGSNPVSVDRVLAGIIVFKKKHPSNIVRFRNCYMMHIKNTPSSKAILVINGNDSRRTLIDCMMYALHLGMNNKKLKRISYYLTSGSYDIAPSLFGNSASLDQQDSQDILTIDVPSLVKLSKSKRAA